MPPVCTTPELQPVELEVIVDLTAGEEGLAARIQADRAPRQTGDPFDIAHGPL